MFNNSKIKKRPNILTRNLRLKIETYSDWGKIKLMLKKLIS